MTILYRQESDIQDFANELAAMSTHFLCTPSRSAINDSLVIGRYSCLPYYRELEEDLKYVNSRLINSYKEHRFIADIMNWYGVLEGLTPKTWARLEDVPNSGSFVLKGETNSKKFLWDTHMFAADRKAATQVYCRLLDDSLVSTQNICIREYVPLHRFFTGTHGLPITEEFRFFICNGKIVSSGFYWSNFVDELDPVPSPDIVPTSFMDEVISRIGDSAIFYVVDVARTAAGDWIVIELNDGQMSGLSENDPFVLYKNLKDVLIVRTSTGVCDES